MNGLSLLLGLGWAAFCIFSTAAQGELPGLKIGNDHRHIVTSDGKPFFLLGDTAWELFHRLTREETEVYLKNRADKGFNTVLAVALAEFEFGKPNAYGELPLENNDPTRPRDAYFQHVDWIVNKAASLGMYTALLPTWGDKWNKKWGKGPEIFTPENAAIYCEWLARRYKDKPIIWVLGGDRPVESDTQRAIIRAMAAGLKKGDGGTHLITYHPKGSSNSSDYWPDEPWLDFHMFQSGHSHRAKPNHDMNARNLALPALKPTLDGEPCYEDHPVRSLMKNGKPTEWFDDHDVRRAAWWSVLSGACGHVYGTHSIWQFHDLEKRTQQTDARTPWQQALDLPGAAQMGVMKKFMEGLDWTKLRRDDSFIYSSMGGSAPENKVMAAVAEDGSFAVVYVPGDFQIEIVPQATKLKIERSQIANRFFSASTGRGISAKIHTGGIWKYEPGFNKEDTNRDWLLVLKRKLPVTSTSVEKTKEK
ncbi:MAG TPA: DUF4038 domain-containing protein [Prosthecobacter sp.]